MRALIAAAPLLAFLLMGACTEPEVLFSERTDPAALAEAGPSSVAQRQVPLHIVDGFSDEQEAKIIAAVIDWNRNAAVRFDLAALNYSRAEPGAWSVVKLDDAVGRSVDDSVSISSGRGLEPAAVTCRSSAGSGSIIVYVNRLGSRDLRAVIAQELAVASGDDDDPGRSAACTASARR
jgi:hypothetical protein